MLIQDAVPVEQSKVWQLLQGYYEQRGPMAWADGSVPQGSTSNACIADAYAGIVAEWLRDLGPQPAHRRPLVLELGGGNGRFAWQFMQRLLKYHWSSEEGAPQFTYLLTDAADSNLQAWQREPRFARLHEQGLMDFGCLMVHERPEIRWGDRTLSPADLRDRPLVIIANYLFDSIPNDLYRVRDGKLQRVFMALTSDDPATIAGRPETFATLTPQFSAQDVEKAQTGLPLLDEIVGRYVGYGQDMAIPVPRLGFQFVEQFASRNAPLLMLASDLAFTDPAYFPNKPPFLFNEYFAQYINFHAFAELFKHHGGAAQFQRQADPNFTAAAFWLPGQEAGPALEKTRAAARAQLAEFAPLDAIELMDLLQASIVEASFSQLFAWMRFSRFDPRVAQTCLPLFIENFHRSDEGLDRRVLRDMYLESYDLYLPDGVDDRFDYEIAQLFLALGFAEDAQRLLQGSIAEFGRTPERLYVYALCLLRLERRSEAKALLEEALAERPDFAAARQVQEEHFGVKKQVKSGEAFPQFTVSCRDPEVAAKSHAMMVEHGVVLFRDMFPRSYIDEVAAAFMERYEDWKKDEMGKPNSVGNKRWTVPLRMVAPFSDPALFANRILIDMIREQLVEEPIICAYGGVITYPGANSQHIHREHPLLFANDQTNAQLPMYAANLLIPLADMNEELGGTQVWSGTHRLGTEEKWEGPSKVLYPRKGDAIAMDYRTYHGGMQCKGDKVRPLLFISYSMPWFRDTLAFQIHDAVAISPSEREAIPEAYREYFRFARRIQDRPVPAPKIELVAV